MIDKIGSGGLGGIRMPGELPEPSRSFESATAASRLDQPTAGVEKSGFAQTLGNLVQDVDQLQHQSNDVFRSFLRGEAELHDAALASHEAGIALRLTAEIRDRLLEAYRETMRTQM